MMLQVGEVLLPVIDLVRFERENVYSPDGADLLYVLVTIGVTCEFAPGGDPRMVSVTAVSPEAQAALDGAVVANPPSNLPTRSRPRMEHDQPGTGRVSPSLWRSGPETDAELVRLLRVPRQRTILWAYARQTGAPVRWLESPRPGMTVDCTVGPTPVKCDVISAKGEPNSVCVYYEFQTAVPATDPGADKFVLSHRWRMRHTYDDNYYLTRVTTGRIVFNAGLRDQSGTNPDWVRNQFILPIPLGFTRTVDFVEMSPDGTTIDYQVSDADPTVCFSPGNSGATQMSIIETSQYSAPLGKLSPNGNGVAGPNGSGAMITLDDTLRGMDSIFDFLK